MFKNRWIILIIFTIVLFASKLKADDLWISLGDNMYYFPSQFGNSQIYTWYLKYTGSSCIKNLYIEVFSVSNFAGEVKYIDILPSGINYNQGDFISLDENFAISTIKYERCR